MQANEEDIYIRPLKIKNEDLLIKEETQGQEPILKIKSHIQNIYDYIKVDKPCWEYLKAWYGYDYEIKFENDSDDILSKSRSNSNKSL